MNMNVNKLPNADDPLARNRDIASRQRIDQANEAGEASGTPEKASVDQSEIRPPRDSFQASADRKRIQELTDMVQDMEAPVREEAVAKARQRVSEGYYDSREFLGNLAAKLINTGTAP